jgi:non-heme chloroperoxidase
MPEFTTSDGAQLFYKDWGAGQPIVFSHGWPLSGDAWDAQMMFFVRRGFRVIAHDRRGHGRSAQVSGGHDTNHHADDLAELAQHLDVREAVLVGHSTGGGEIARYIGRHGEDRVAKAVLISAVTPSVLRTPSNPAGIPLAGLRGLQARILANRSECYRTLAAGPFYNLDETGTTGSEAVIGDWWRQAMSGAANAQHDGVTAVTEDDWSGDLGQITVPVLILNGDADRILPYRTSGPRAVELVENGTLTIYPGFPHGMPTTHADVINADLLAFIRS